MNSITNFKLKRGFQDNWDGEEVSYIVLNTSTNANKVSHNFQYFRLWQFSGVINIKKLIEGDNKLYFNELFFGN
jgi:hypothetical protein